MRYLLTLALLGITLATNVAQGADDRSPNVVLIISDDQAWTDFGFMGSKVVQTPNLDRLSKESATFRHGYVPTSLCRASLASIITGLYPRQHGVVSNDQPDGQPRSALSLGSIPTIPFMLAEVGYKSLQTGKFWEGHYSNAGFTDGMTTQGRHGEEGLDIGRKTMKPVIDFIDKNRNNPFFVWYAPMMPHQPHNPPERFLKKYETKDRPIELAKYYAMCEWFDETCGVLLDELDRQKLTDNTLVIFLVDNGWIQETGDKKTTRGNFAPKSKLSPYDGGLRTPILVKWPGHTKAGNYDDLVSSIDIAPTILTACKAPLPEILPGLSLLDVAAGKGPLKRNSVSGAIYTHTAIDVKHPDANETHRWIRVMNWKLIVPNDPLKQPELYDLETDPLEVDNVASQYPERVLELKRQLDEEYDDDEGYSPGTP